MGGIAESVANGSEAVVQNIALASNATASNLKVSPRIGRHPAYADSHAFHTSFAGLSGMQLNLSYTEYSIFRHQVDQDVGVGLLLCG